MKFIDENNLLLTTGDFRYRTLAQKDDQIFGKVLKINTIDKSANIIAKGLRNSQGLFLDKLNNLIFLTDHGPAGGDEINVVDLNTNKVENLVGLYLLMGSTITVKRTQNDILKPIT